MVTKKKAAKSKPKKATGSRADKMEAAREPVVFPVHEVPLAFHRADAVTGDVDRFGDIGWRNHGDAWRPADYCPTTIEKGGRLLRCQSDHASKASHAAVVTVDGAMSILRWWEQPAGTVRESTSEAGWE